jgi:hypothetical protein
VTLKSQIAPLVLSLPFAVVAPAVAQPAPPVSPEVTVPPVSLILPNYNSVPVGEVAGLEGGAFVARANDSSAGFYNPAGLARAEQSSISGSAGAYQFGSVSPEAFTNEEGTFQQIPSTFAVLVSNLGGRANLAGGFTVTRSSAWNQTVDAEVVSSSAGGPNRLRFSTAASYNAWLASLGVGYARNDRLHVGLTLDAQYTSFERRQSVTTQLISGTALSAATLYSLGGVSTTHLRATVGAQISAGRGIQVGAVLRTPGLGITASGQASLEGLIHVGTGTAASAFFDPSASSRYRLPLEFKIGGAWIGTRAQAEVDVLTYAGTGQYTAAESSLPVSVVVDAGQGGPPVVSQVPYQGPRIDSRTVVNVAVGGRYQLKEGRSWTLHGGYITDRSPVGDDDAAFTKVNLQHMTVGLSGRTSLFLGSFGFRYSTGRSAPVTLGATADGSIFETRFKVTSIGLLYSLALLF